MSSYRSTAVLAVVFALLCVAYWGVHQIEFERKQQAIEAKDVFDFEGETVQSLEIAPLGEPTAAAKRTEDGWQFIKPNPDIRALDLLWDRVARNLAQLRSERSIAESPENLAFYGLGEPVLTIRAKTGHRDWLEFQLDFGAVEPTQTYRYAKVSGGPVFLVEEDQFFELNRKLEELRHRFLVDNRESPLVHIEFARIWTGKGETDLEDPPEIGEESVRVVLQRANENDPWQMTEPVNARANQERVNELAREIQYGVARDFIDEPAALADYGLDPPRVRITVHDKDTGRPQTLYIGDVDELSDKGGIFATRKAYPAVFLIDPHILTLFPRSPSAFRERRLLTRQASTLARIKIVTRDHIIQLENDPDEGWQFAGPDKQGVNQIAISHYVSLLKAIQAHSFLDDAPAAYGLDRPSASIELYFEESAETGKIRLKPFGKDENYYAATQDNGQPVLIFARDAEELIVAPVDFRSRTLFQVSREQATRIEFQFEGSGYVVEKAHGKWVVNEPENHRLENQSDIDTLLDAVTPLRGDPVPIDIEITADAAGLKQPVFTCYITTRPENEAEAPTRHGPLQIGGPTNDGQAQRYAAAAGRQDLYRVDQSVIEAIRDALRGIRPE